MSFLENRRGENRALRTDINEVLSVIYKFIVKIAETSI
jgi:hypothetical protein